MRIPRRTSLALLTSLFLLVGLLPLGPAAQADVTITALYSFTTPNGAITFTRYRDVSHSTAPNDTDATKHYTRIVNVLEISVPGDPTVDVVMPKSSTPGSRKLSAMVPDEQNSVAGINGDFGIGRPEHALAVDGTLWQTGARVDANFALAQSEQKGFVKKPNASIGVQDNAGAPLFGVDKWNEGQPASDAQVVGFSPKSTDSNDSPASGQASCAARLLNAPSPGPEWAGQKKGVIFNYTVDKVRCVSDTQTQLSENGKTMLYATKKTGAGALNVKSLTEGQNIKIKWSLGFPGAIESIGGNPQILNDNAVTPEATGFACHPKSDQHADHSKVTVGCRNGRAVVGINQACTTGEAGCKVFLVVVDGRQTNWSAGYGLADMATFMRDTVGAYDALNLDGGGSVGMWIKKDAIPQDIRDALCQTVSNAANTTDGCFVNRPTTDGSTIAERAIESSIVLKNGPDTGKVNVDDDEPIPTGP